MYVSTHLLQGIGGDAGSFRQITTLCQTGLERGRVQQKGADVIVNNGRDNTVHRQGICGRQLFWAAAGWELGSVSD
jgi:hypothetical protein